MAQIVLKNLSPDRYAGLELADKPDLQDIERDIGVEVVRAIAKDEGEIEGWLGKYPFFKGKEKEIADKIFSRYGGKFLDGEYRIFCWPVRADNFDLVLSVLGEKLKKLNEGGYVEIKHNELFVDSSILADRNMLVEALQTMLDRQAGFDIKFERVFVCVPSWLYIFDLIDGCASGVKLHNQSEWLAEARNRVESNV